MTNRARQRLAVAVVLVTTAAALPSVNAQPPAAELHLLDVPYLPQSESLCGGAAIAMLMRYWGTTNVYAETFANLFDPAASGIHGGDLVKALRSRGYDAESFHGDPDQLKERLQARQPIVVLIEDRPGRFHYVVLVGWAGGRVVVHDPARAPFRTLDEKTFLRAWAVSDNWTLAATPAHGIPVAVPDRKVDDTPAASASADEPCRDLIQEGIRLANGDQVTRARELFEDAATSCPRAPGPWREMAGLHALAGEWHAAAIDARRALSKDASDALAARILATSLFLEDDAEGALDAWNRVGEPLVDLINVAGLERTRYAVATRVMGLEPQTMLTQGTLVAARRRLAELPAAQATRVAMRPGDNGRAYVDASIIERPLIPSSTAALGAMALRALTDREAIVTIANPTGGGEAWSGTWRWWEHRPKVGLAFDAVAPFGGLWGVSLLAERQTYEADGTTIEETRRRAEFHVSNWTAHGLRWEATGGIERFARPDAQEGRQALSLGGRVEGRFAGDRLALALGGDAWVGQLRTWAVGLRSEWRSNIRHEGTVWIARAQDNLTGADAPLALWSGAGTGQGRDGLLRAHALIHDGIIGNAVFGRHVIGSGVEAQRWMQLPKKPLKVAPAIFVDIARAYRALDSQTERWQADLGAGLRFSIPGAGVLRIDVAHGLADGRTALSVGWGK